MRKLINLLSGYEIDNYINMPPKQRPLYLVIEALKSQIPPDYKNRNKFIESLKKLQNDLFYQDPQIHRNRWFELFTIVEEFVPIDNEFQKFCKDLIEAKLSYLDYVVKGNSKIGPMSKKDEQTWISSPVVVVYQNINILPIGILEKAINDKEYP